MDHKGWIYTGHMIHHWLAPHSFQISYFGSKSRSPGVFIWASMTWRPFDTLTKTFLYSAHLFLSLRFISTSSFVLWSIDWFSTAFFQTLGREYCKCEPSIAVQLLFSLLELLVMSWNTNIPQPRPQSLFSLHSCRPAFPHLHAWVHWVGLMWLAS